MITEGLSYDEVLILPNYSDVNKNEVDLSCNLTPKIRLKTPIISSPMDTVTEARLAVALAQVGGIGIVHRNLTIEEQVQQIKKVKKSKVKNKSKAALDSKKRLLVGGAVGVGPDLKNRLKALVRADVDVIVLDSAHGHCEYIVNTVQEIRDKYPKLELIAGNVGTGEGALALIKAGASCIRVGLGPGSICTTRIVSGVGVPQLTAVIDCVKTAQNHNVPVIADGGIKYSGDITKALGAGADTVMLGSLLAKTKEAPGKVVEHNGKKYKYYRGMGSIAAMKKGSASRYGQSIRAVAGKMVAEGVEGLVPYKGKLKDFVYQLIGGLKAGMVYVGAHNLQELKQRTRFIKISSASLAESHPHSINITNSGANYDQK